MYFTNGYRISNPVAVHQEFSRPSCWNKVEGFRPFGNAFRIKDPEKDNWK
jgi:hypothetical protein